MTHPGWDGRDPYLAWKEFNGLETTGNGTERNYWEATRKHGNTAAAVSPLPIPAHFPDPQPPPPLFPWPCLQTPGDPAPQFLNFLSLESWSLSAPPQDSLPLRVRKSFNFPTSLAHELPRIRGVFDPPTAPSPGYLLATCFNPVSAARPHLPPCPRSARILLPSLFLWYEGQRKAWGWGQNPPPLEHPCRRPAPLPSSWDLQSLMSEVSNLATT